MSTSVSFSLDDDLERLAHVCGPVDGHLRWLERECGVRIRHRGARFTVQGEAAVQVRAMLEELQARALEPVHEAQLALLLAQFRQTPALLSASGANGGRSAGTAATQGSEAASDRMSDLGAGDDTEPASRAAKHHARSSGGGGGGSGIASSNSSPNPSAFKRLTVKPRTPHQAEYLQHIVAHDLSFGIGPAGTGKTYLAVAAAVDALERDLVKRLVLTRPAVEAGERLGFLPGDLAQKVDPYLRPLFDALYELLGLERTQRLLERGIIEVAPLAFMRGRTLNSAFILLDEAQNTTIEQMKMFLTRIGYHAKMVVNGDVTQIDLPKGQKSGLVHAAHILERVPGVAFTWFDAGDIVRHPLVARIVEAYVREGQPR